ncbi:mobilization protein, partial [Aeromonas salmonicida]
AALGSLNSSVAGVKSSLESLIKAQR